MYLDSLGDVHAVDINGADRRLTSAGQMLRPAVAADGRTAAWLVGDTAGTEAEKALGSSELVVWRNGLQRSIKCEPFIRDFWFWKSGRYVAIDCGGAHFAGAEVLYDADTMEKVAVIDAASVPAERRPAWSTSSAQYRPD